MKMVQDYDPWADFAQNAPRVIRGMIFGVVCRMIAEGRDDEKIKTAIKVLQGPLVESEKMGHGEIHDLILKRRAAPKEKPFVRKRETLKEVLAKRRSSLRFPSRC